MGSSMNVNKKTVVHSGSGGQGLCFPDICKTPTPAGPTPMPYPNQASSSNAASTTTTVKVDSEGIMIEGSNFSMSSGDEAGSAGGGITSNKIKGKAEFTNHSSDVKADGKAVARLTDSMKQNDANGVDPGELQGPIVVIDKSKLGETQEEACAKIKNCEVSDHGKAAHDAGMLKGDYDAIRNTCKFNKIAATFRDTNQACLPHLAAGVPSKGHDVLTKTFPADNLPEGDKNLAGLVSTLDKKPGPGQIIDNPRSKVHGPPELTGDYDMMDMIGNDGARIPGESPRDINFRQSLNKGLPNGGQPPRIMHGCQSEYGNYLKTASKSEEPIKELFKPEKPLTAFGADGKVHRLESHADVVNYYKCKGTAIPPQWRAYASSPKVPGSKTVSKLAETAYTRIK